MKDFDINIDVRAFGIIHSTILQSAKVAFDAVVYNIQQQWKNWASGSGDNDLPANPFPSTRLRQSIHTVYNHNFSATIKSDSLAMKRIIEGVSEYDMKKTYPFGNKSRVSKGGVPYLIVPFRWGTPNKAGTKRAHFASVVPQSLVSIARALATSSRLDTVHYESNAQGKQVLRSEYNWGGRIQKGDTDNANAVGMVRMANSGGYFTFRVISAKSAVDKWIRKAKPGVPILDALIKANKDNAEEAINTAIAEALKE